MKRMPVPDDRSRIQRHREAMRSRGMRPVQIWVSDTRTEAFRLEAKRQCSLANAADERDDALSWLESVSVFDEPQAG